MESAQQERRVPVNEGGREWEGAAAKGRHHDAERPPSALSTSSLSSISCTASSASLPRTSPLLLSPTNSTSPPPSNCGDAGVMESPGGAPALMKARRPSSASGGGAGIADQIAQGGLFRRSKSTPSLQHSSEEQEVGGRRTLWGWGQRPLLPPPHFYYCPHTPPRNKELRHEDIPEGVDRVKALKKRIESETLPVLARREGADRGQKPGAAETMTRRRTLNGALQPKAAPLPYRAPSFGGSMIQLNHKSTTLPLRGGGTNSTQGKDGNINQNQKKEKTWSSTLPRDGVQTMYWNGISTIGRNKTPKASPTPTTSARGDSTSEEDGEVRVSPSTLERIRARGSSVTYFGGRVVKQGAPADPTIAIMEEIRRQRATEVTGGGKWTKVLPGNWPPEAEEETLGSGRDSSYGSAESTPTPSEAPTPPLPPASPPRTPSPPAKVVSAMAKGDGGLQRPLWSGQCSVVFDFRPGKARDGGKLCY